MAQNQKIDWRLLALALLVTVLVRGGVLLTTANSSLSADPDAYRQLAVSWSNSGVFGTDGVPTAYRPPLYPAILSVFGSDPRSVAILHLVAGLITVAGTFLLCCRVGLARWAFFAAMLVTFDPILLSQSTQVMTETLATMLVVLAILSMVSIVERQTLKRAALAGVLLGLAELCRPELLAWAGLCVVTMPFLLRAIAFEDFAPLMSESLMSSPDLQMLKKHLTTVTAKLALVTLVTVLLTLTPWMVRNYKVFGRPIPTTTHGGYTLLLANNGPFYEYLRSGEWGSTWDADDLGPKWAGHAKFPSPAEELQADREAYRETWSTIRREPGMFLYSCLIRAGRLWGLVPHQGPKIARYAVGLWYLGLYTLAVMGAWTIWRKKADLTSVGWAIWLWGGMLAISTTAVHTLFWSNMRMRAPLIPILALVATAGLANLATKWRQRRANSSSKDKV